MITQLLQISHLSTTVQTSLLIRVSNLLGFILMVIIVSINNVISMSNWYFKMGSQQKRPLPLILPVLELKQWKVSGQL